MVQMPAGTASKAGLGAALLLLALALFGCGDSLPKLQDLNPFAEKELPLPGKRIAVIQQENLRSDASAAGRPLALPRQQANDSWSQPGGVASNAPGHLALSSTPKQAWSVSVGTGSSFYGKVTASPIVYGGNVYALDAAGQVTAVSASGGSVVWRASTTPPTEKGQEGFGGGLAAEAGRIYAATGYGTMVALDAKSGRKLWEKTLGPPLRASPTAQAERVFAVTTEGQVYCLSGSDGAELWTFTGLPERASILANASPAVDKDMAVVPYPTGDLVALRTSNGQPIWQESLARTASGSSLNAMSDAARPVLYGGVMYAVGHGGRMIASSQKNGERIWSISVGGIDQPWVAGDSVFVVDSGGQLVAVTRTDGRIRWATKLGDGTWSGPVLAGNRLWVVSSKGQLVGVEPENGRVATSESVGESVLIAPVVAGGRLYVLSDNARLYAFN
ncbi:MAG: PQQ-binding-like beta-propeller repeat protein [Hyphomicrobiaceae bacterium]|nr:PQQ-binding-like beta-propeller repeat protein [Hyphomicrobiaceae bacterium]